MKAENRFKSHNEAESIILSEGGCDSPWKLLRDILAPLDPWYHLYGSGHHVHTILYATYSSSKIIYTRLFNKISAQARFRPFVQYVKWSGGQEGAQKGAQVGAKKGQVQVQSPCFGLNKCCPPPIVFKYAKSSI